MNEDRGNEDMGQGKWNQLKGEAKKKWGKLTDDDLMIHSGHREKMVGSLQTKYGYSKEEAEQEYKSFLDEHQDDEQQYGGQKQGDKQQYGGQQQDDKQQFRSKQQDDDKQQYGKQNDERQYDDDSDDDSF